MAQMDMDKQGMSGVNKLRLMVLSQWCRVSAPASERPRPACPYAKTGAMSM